MSSFSRQLEQSFRDTLPRTCADSAGEVVLTAIDSVLSIDGHLSVKIFHLPHRDFGPQLDSTQQKNITAQEGRYLREPLPAVTTASPINRHKRNRRSR